MATGGGIARIVNLGFTVSWRHVEAWRKIPGH